MERRRKILVVDDTELFRDLGSLFLSRSGHVLTASDGGKGLELARAEHPAVVVVDLDMPGLGGDDVCRAIKADPELDRVPVVILTSGDAPEDHARAVRAGADDVIPKPLNRISLIQAVNRLLRPLERGLVRVPVETEVRIRCDHEDAWGVARNLSRGGLFVSANRAVPPDTEVELEFALPDSATPISPTAQVVWTHCDGSGRPDGMGLRFLALDRRSAVRIEEFVYTHPTVDEEPTAAAGGSR